MEHSSYGRYAFGAQFAKVLVDPELKVACCRVHSATGEPLEVDRLKWFSENFELSAYVAKLAAGKHWIDCATTRKRADHSLHLHESLGPFAQATFNVSWSGEETSLNWFDTARELTERWHHQQQIRLATNRPGIMTPELYHPVLDCFVRGLPHAYRHTDAASGTSILLEISGECGGRWILLKGGHGWGFARQVPQEIACKVTCRKRLRGVFSRRVSPRNQLVHRLKSKEMRLWPSGFLGSRQ
jgi:hypothetical protein